MRIVAPSPSISPDGLSPLASQLEPPACSGKAAEFDVDEPPVYAGWGLQPFNTRYVPHDAAGIDARNVGRLK